ncbi:MAG: sulfate reduction electron transfer complex DsrMKJOP subunit DsrJ [Desulfatibacillaceae bacterium]
MYNKGPIITGLVIFFILFTSPVWLNFGATATVPERSFNTPKLQEMADQAGMDLEQALAENAIKCVEDADDIIPQHMFLLDQWRDNVVRKGNRMYSGAFGKRYEMSLSNTCMDCHSNKAEFCDRCHNYVNVSPVCWDCHLTPEQMGTSSDTEAM